MLMVPLLIWWFALLLVGLVAVPVTLRLLRFLPDRGFGFARQVGLVLAGYIFWLLTSLGILQNTRANIVSVLLAVAALSVYLLARDRSLVTELRSRWRIILVTEGLLFASMAAFALFRAYNPDIAATEKPMEFGFINAILRSRSFPPADPWLSGYSLSYYYFGYVMVAMMTKLTGIPSDIAFNLTGITLFSLTVTGSFSLVTNLVQAARNNSDGIVSQAAKVIMSWGSICYGLLGSVLVALMGNLEGIFEIIRARGGGSDALWRWLDVKNLSATPTSARWYPDDMWWWWRASRVIHDRNAAGQSVEVIDEFPFFSFLLGDNHPHVLTLPFVLLALALALNLLLSRHAESTPSTETNKGDLVSRAKGFLADLWPGGIYDWVMWGLCLGGLGFLNTWDFPIYLGIFVLAYGVWRSGRREPGANWLSQVVTAGLVLLLLGGMLYFPFYISFRSQAGGIGIVGLTKTRLLHFLLMMGVFVFIIAGYLVALWTSYARHTSDERKLPLLAQIVGGLFALVTIFSLVQGWWMAALCFGLMGLAATLLVWGSGPREEQSSTGATLLSQATLFSLLLIVCGLLLTVSVEFVFLKDTFGTRMNTIFKFYYQAWVLLALGAAYGAAYVVSRLRSARVTARAAGVIWAIGACLLIGAGLSYTVAATASKAGSFRGEASLDGTRYVARYRPDDYAAIQWLRENASEGTVMLEAPGGSYSEYNWVSAHTGIPTLLGWGGHELQWRGNYDEPGKREPDIASIYQGTDARATAQLLGKYSVDYVYVGQLERSKYRLSQPALAKFDLLMDRLYENNSVTIYGWAR